MPLVSQSNSLLSCSIVAVLTAFRIKFNSSSLLKTQFLVQSVIFCSHSSLSRLIIEQAVAYFDIFGIKIRLPFLEKLCRLHPKTISNKLRLLFALGETIGLKSIFRQQNSENQEEDRVFFYWSYRVPVRERNQCCPSDHIKKTE